MNKFNILNSLPIYGIAAFSALCLSGCGETDNSDKKLPIPKPVSIISTTEVGVQDHSNVQPDSTKAVKQSLADTDQVQIKAVIQNETNMIEAVAVEAKALPLLRDKNGWPQLPDNSLLPGQPETYRLTLEAFRIEVEKARKRLEERRSAREIGMDEYLPEIAIYFQSIDQYREAIKSYQQLFRSE